MEVVRMSKKTKQIEIIIRPPKLDELRSIFLKKSWLPWKKEIPRPNEEQLKKCREYILQNSKPKLDIFSMEGEKAIPILERVFSNKPISIINATEKIEKADYIG